MFRKILEFFGCDVYAENERLRCDLLHLSEVVKRANSILDKEKVKFPTNCHFSLNETLCERIKILAERGTPLEAAVITSEAQSELIQYLYEKLEDMHFKAIHGELEIE